MFDKKQVLKRRPANLLPYSNNISITKLLQEPKIILLELVPQEITKVLEDDGNNNIDYSHLLSTFLDTESFNFGNLDTKSTLRKSLTC